MFKKIISSVWQPIVVAILVSLVNYYYFEPLKVVDEKRMMFVEEEYDTVVSEYNKFRNFYIALINAYKTCGCLENAISSDSLKKLLYRIEVQMSVINTRLCIFSGNNHDVVERLDTVRDELDKLIEQLGDDNNIPLSSEAANDIYKEILNKLYSVYLQYKNISIDASRDYLRGYVVNK